MGSPSVNEQINLEDLKKVDSSTFFTALKNAKGKNLHGAYVTLHEVEDYNSCKGVFLLYDYSAGIAVEADGNIISVFSDGTHKGVLKFLLTKAVEVGGNKLDCFGSERLRLLYLYRGFIPISRTKFVREFAPEDWNYVQDGEPDILFWIFDKSLSSPMEDSKRIQDWDSIKEFASYEEAMRYRDRLIEK